MCFINERTLIVCLLSSDPMVRAYECDLIAELNAKGLGARKLVVSADDSSADLCNGSDLAISYEFPGNDPDDADLALLAFEHRRTISNAGADRCQDVLNVVLRSIDHCHDASSSAYKLQFAEPRRQPRSCPSGSSLLDQRGPNSKHAPAQ